MIHSVVCCEEIVFAIHRNIPTSIVSESGNKQYIHLVVIIIYFNDIIISLQSGLLCIFIITIHCMFVIDQHLFFLSFPLLQFLLLFLVSSFLLSFFELKPFCYSCGKVVVVVTPQLRRIFFFWTKVRVILLFIHFCSFALLLCF